MFNENDSSKYLNFNYQLKIKKFKKPIIDYLIN